LSGTNGFLLVVDVKESPLLFLPSVSSCSSTPIVADLVVVDADTIADEREAWMQKRRNIFVCLLNVVVVGSGGGGGLKGRGVLFYDRNICFAR